MAYNVSHLVCMSHDSSCMSCDVYSVVYQMVSIEIRRIVASCSREWSNNIGGGVSVECVVHK